MLGDEVYELHIDALTPATISLARLAEYMADFAELLGYQEFHRSAMLIEFPGRTRAVERNIGPVEQAGTLDGEIIQIGGRDESINVHLRAGDDVVHCIATKAVARRLAHHIFGPPVRLSGVGMWSRSESGKWAVRSFTIRDFETLDQTPLPKLFENLRAKLAPGPQGRPNPVTFLRELREEQ